MRKYSAFRLQASKLMPNLIHFSVMIKPRAAKIKGGWVKQRSVEN